jgi:hypothetical protein
VKELYDNGIEGSKMGEQIFTINCEVFGWPLVVSDDLVQSVAIKICEQQFHNFRTFE